MDAFDPGRKPTARVTQLVAAAPVPVPVQYRTADLVADLPQLEVTRVLTPLSRRRLREGLRVFMYPDFIEGGRLICELAALLGAGTLSERVRIRSFGISSGRWCFGLRLSGWLEVCFGSICF